EIEPCARDVTRIIARQRRRCLTASRPPAFGWEGLGSSRRDQTAWRLPGFLEDRRRLVQTSCHPPIGIWKAAGLGGYFPGLSFHHQNDEIFFSDGQSWLSVSPSYNSPFFIT